MARVTASEVLVILPEETTLKQPQVEAAITAATCLVDRLATATDLTTDCLKSVELYLSAHFGAASDPALSVSSEKEPHLKTSVTYGFKFGEGLMGTSFGQMANTLSGGALMELDKQPAGLFAIGSV